MGKIKEHAKKNVANYTKVIAALATLTAAVNGYLNLAEQNELMLQALGSKLNSLAVKVAYMEGRLDVAPYEARVIESMKPKIGKHHSSPVKRAVSKAMDKPKALFVPSKEVETATHTEAVAKLVAVSPIQRQMQVQFDAYDEVPLSMEDLKTEAQEQVQVE